MTEANQGLLVLAGIAVACAVVAHRRIRRRGKASLVAAVAASLLFQFAAYIKFGVLDPSALIVFVVGGVIAWVVAVVVGLALRWRKTTDETTVA